MAEEKMTIVDLRKAIAKQTETDEAVVNNFLTALFPAISEGLKKDKQVRINGLGTFKLQWVEPRKSVNISTGEPIVIEGYQKLGFTPEQSVKERVNEPYANLDPVELDENGMPIPNAPVKAAIDPIQKMDEQAMEIKDLLADLGANTEKSAEEPTAEPEVAETAESTEEVAETAETTKVAEENIATEETKEEEPTAEEPTAEEPVVVVPEEQQAEAVTEVESVVEGPTPETAEEEPVVVTAEETAKTEETAQEPESEPKEEPKKKKEKKKRPFRPWLVALITILIFCLILIGGYFYLVNKIEDFANGLKHNIENAQKETCQAEPAAEETAVFEEAIEVISEDSVPEEVAAEEIAEVVSKPVQKMDEERTYTEFIATETVADGSRLTWIAKKHYGNKEYWVLIYEANRDKMRNPSSVATGMQLRIPQIPESLKNWSDPAVQAYIKQLQEKYL